MASDGKVTINTKLNNKGIEDGIKDISGMFGGLTGVVKKLAASIASAFAVKAITDFVKSSVDAYAEWEQLVGGVGTMFGEDAKKVTEYAENAFYTAGISANEYMNTVTSFSASLISSLGGNTEKAADVANMAIVDMADNANKMGSSLESIQTAYQGFAKQQYQLLDNLKLGYGGTKTEMERLLKDAEAYSGVKYDINSLSDVYNAIHAIQEKMGIAGATAKEAEGTIAGAANMTKAAWKNVITAISGGGDLDRAINNLVYSVTKYFDNIVPVVERSLSGVGQLIEKIAPQLVQTVAMSLIKALPSLLNAVAQMFKGLAVGIYQGIAALFTSDGSVKEVSKQLHNVASSAGAAGAAEAELAEGIEEANAAAKKSLAGFDELNKLQDNTATAEVADVGAVNISGAIGQAEDLTLNVGLSEDIAPWMQGLIEKIKGYLEPLKSIDFGPLMGSVKKLEKPFTSLGTTVEKSLSWAWNKILVPLAKWTIEKAAPAAVDLFRAALDVLNETATALQPLGEWLWDSFLQPIADWTGGVIVDVLTGITDGLTSVSDWISENQTLVEDITLVIGSFVAAWGLVNIAIGIWNVISTIATAVTTGLGAAVAFLTSPIGIITVAIGALIAIVVLLVKHWDDVKAAAVKCWEWIKDTWNSVAQWFDENVIQPVVTFFTDLWESIEGAASSSWEWIKGVWNSVATWVDENVVQPVSGFFTDLWEGVSEGATNAWDNIKEAFSQVGDFFKGILNGVIGALNDAIDWIFSGVNDILSSLKEVEVLGNKPFSGISTINTPQIPLLAKGAVLPANKPFLAMVGDQRHGTNVEAPLSTIQEAVALVMQDQTSAILAGFEASVGVQREILEAVLGIQIGDDVIGNAVTRYTRKQAIIKGGVL